MTTRLTVNKTPTSRYASVLASHEDFLTPGALWGIENTSPAIPHPGRLDPEHYDSLSRAVYVVYSYGTPIAWDTPDGWVVPKRKYSATTSNHQNIVRAALIDFEEV